AMPKPPPMLPSPSLRFALTAVCWAVLTWCLVGGSGCTRPRPSVQGAEASNSSPGTGGGAALSLVNPNPPQAVEYGLGGPRRDVAGFVDGEVLEEADGYQFFRDRVEPRLVERCGSCH